MSELAGLETSGNRRKVISLSREFKVCEVCETRFARKPGRTHADWQKARFCGMDCLRAWQKDPQGGAKRRGSTGQIAFCEACDRTFWRVGSQTFCRDPGCRDERNRRDAMKVVKERGTQEDYDEMMCQMRERELSNLIDDQWHDDRYGNQAGHGMAGGGWIWWMTAEDLDRFYQNDIQTRNRARPQRRPKVKRFGAFGALNSHAVFR